MKKSRNYSINYVDITNGIRDCWFEYDLGTLSKQREMLLVLNHIDRINLIKYRTKKNSDGSIDRIHNNDDFWQDSHKAFFKKICGR